MSQLGLQIIIVVAFGVLCFGCGYLTAFIVTRNKWRDAMIKRRVARYLHASVILVEAIDSEPDLPLVVPAVGAASLAVPRVC